MNQNTILTPGEKLKDIRKKCGFTQDEVAGTHITRNLISLIESNKASLTSQVAELVTKNINELCVINKIDISIKPEYLLESIEMQVKERVQLYLQYLTTRNLKVSEEFEDKVIEIDNFISLYEFTDLKFNIYSLIAEVYLNNTYYRIAYKYYIKAYENSGKLSSENLPQINLICSLSFCCSKLSRYKESIDYLQLIEPFGDNLPEGIHFKIKFNKSINYKKSNQFDNCLKELDFIEKYFTLDNNSQFSILTLKANCYKEKKLYNKALILHKELLSFIQDNSMEHKLMALSNIIEVYMLLHDTNNIKLYLDICLKFTESYDKLEYEEKTCSQEIYNDIGLAMRRTNNNEGAIIYFFKAIDVARVYKNVNPLIESFENLISIYVELGDNIGFNNTKNQLLEFISLDILPKNTTLILKIIQHYNHVGDKENIDNLLTFIL